jgi:dissimilatory sulfite reductase (desulfoviridin) alpha/beta subunit
MKRQAKNGVLMIAVDQEACDYCGCCVGVCPEDAIELRSEFLRIIDERCVNCAKCVWSCPFEALAFRREGVDVGDYGREAS